MIDLNKHDFEENEYQEFLGYVKGSWRSLFECDFHEEVKIKKVIVHNYKNTFDVFVYIEDNVYDDIKDGELVEVVYDGKPIKTSYSLSSEEILYVLIKGTFINDLGLEDVEFVIYDFVDGIAVNDDLTKRLECIEEGYAEDYYCRVHDL